jgi:hypothetical protein
MRALHLSTILIVPLLLSSSAEASAPTAKERAARKACLGGDFQKGVDILTDLFLATGDLTYIFNQGRCLEQNHRYEDAIARFREYVVKGTTLGPEEKADAERHIAACQSYLGQAEPASAPAPPPTPAPLASPLAPPAGPGAPMPIAPVPVAATTTATAMPSQHGDGRGLRVGGVIAASVGVVALAAGIGLNLKANSMTDDLEKPYNYNRSTDSDRKTYKTMAWIGYGVGAAGLATGAVLYLLGWRQTDASAGAAPLTISPAVTTGMAGATLAGSF